MTETEKRVYAPCNKVLEIWPAWKLCERPVKIEEGKQQRCELHPAKPIWPVEADWHDMDIKK